MKRKLFASVCLGLILTASVFSPISITTASLVINRAYAQPMNEDGTYEPADMQEYQNANDSVPGDEPGTYVPSQASGQKEDPSGCAWWNVACHLVMIWASIASLTPFLLATVSGLVLDLTLWLSIQSSTYTAYDGTMTSTGLDEGFVVSGWKLVRDFSNILFIFALFVVGFVLILGLDKGEGGPLRLDPKKTVARVIIMALLVNFSFFLGRVVIDFTNTIALGFYDRITTAPVMTMNALGDSKSDVQGFYQNTPGIKSIAIGVLSLINPQKFVLQNSQGGILATFSNYPKIWFYTLVSAFFSLFLVYIFLSIAVLFVARTLGLFFGIILSPIAFVSYTIPALREKSYFGFDDWMKQFLGLAFMAPIFMFFLYISLQFFKIPITEDSGFISSAAQISIKFAMVAFLLLMAKKVSKDLSGKVGAMVSGVVTSMVTTGAMLAGAAMTGGASTALMGAARQTGTNAAVGAGTRALGGPKTAAFQQRLGSGNFRSLGPFKDKGGAPGGPLALPPSPSKSGFKMPNLGIGKALKDYGKGVLGTTMNIAKLSGSKLPDKITTAFAKGQRAQNINNIRQARIAGTPPNTGNSGTSTTNNTNGTNVPPRTGTQPNGGNTNTNTGSSRGSFGGSRSNFNNASGGQQQPSQRPTYKKEHEILGVPEDAKWEEIKKAWRVNTLKYHPDKNPGNKEAEQRWREVNRAYETLEKVKGPGSGNYQPTTKPKSGGPATAQSSTPTGNQGTKSPSGTQPVSPAAGRAMNMLQNMLGPATTSTVPGELPAELNPSPEEVLNNVASMNNPVIKVAEKVGMAPPGISNLGSLAERLKNYQANNPTMSQPEVSGTPDQHDFGGIQTPQSSESKSGGIAQFISNIPTPSPGLAMMGSTNIGKNVDMLKHLDNPLTNAIPEVGPILRKVGQGANVANKLGITDHSKDSDINLPKAA